MAEVIMSLEAMRDVEDIWDYIADHNPTAADRLLEAFDEKLKLAAESPGLGRLRVDLARSLRSVRVGKYLLFYRPVQNGIELVHAYHGARDLQRLFER